LPQKNRDDGALLPHRASGGSAVKFAVGYKLNGKAGHAIIDAEDALIAALRVKAQRPEAAIMYARRQNKRGDARHPEKESQGGGG
jgi:hypothetical protein